VLQPATRENDRMFVEISTTGMVIRLVLAFIVMAMAFFGSAGTFVWPEAWLYMVFQITFSTVLVVWLKKHNPDLLRERMTFLKQSARGWDKAIVLTLTAILVPYLFLPGLDAVRYQWSWVSLPYKAVGFVGILVSFVLIFWVMRENTYLSRWVEIQQNRGHKVISTGPYRYVRHPMYVGVIVIVFCIPLALGSLWTLIPGALFTALIVIRTHLEDKTLHRELQGYASYADKVRYRLVPGIW
jgi:protein-S-isoprenylcysteine O-methyltransferase Ste14